MNIFYRILFVVIAVCIPAVSILSAFNIVFRMPDLYRYEFNRYQVASQVDLGITDDELGQFFSDFMMEKKDDFDLFTEYRDREQAVFGTVEQINMENARKQLNFTLYIIGGAGILSVLSYLILLIKKKKYELRVAFKAGIFAFTVTLVLFYLLLYIDQTRTFLYRHIFIDPFGADDVLPIMFSKQFPQLSLVAISAVSLVILLILASVTWRLTKPRRMFW
jgi:hypothetical protein